MIRFELNCRQQSTWNTEKFPLTILSGQVFFKNCIVYNYIPLCFIHKTGKNIAPDQLKPATRNRLISLCNEAICEILDILQVKIVIGVGKWTEARLQAIKKENKLQIEGKTVVHVHYNLAVLAN